MAPTSDCLFYREVIRERAWEANRGSINCDLDVEVQRNGGASYELPLDVEDDDLIELLFQKEDNLMREMQDYAGSYEEKDGEKQDRMEVVCWMLHVHAYHGFNHVTALLSVNYFDRFLAKHSSARGKKWLLQLISIACISIAAKLEEVEVLHLLDLQIGQLQHVFEAHTIQRMELLILSTLHWQMSLVTPYSHLHYLLVKLEVLVSLPRSLNMLVEELILYTCRDVRFLRYNPSIVAVACVMCACEEEMPLQTARLKRALLSLWPHKEIMTMECLRLIKEIVQADPFWTSTTKMAVRSSSTPQSPMGVLEAACFSCESSCNYTHATTAATTPTSSLAANQNSTNNKMHQKPSANDRHSSDMAPTPQTLKSSRELMVAGPTNILTFPLPPQPPPRKRKLNEQYIIKKRPHPTITS